MSGATLVRRVELLRQHSQAIKSRDSATLVKVYGDATGLFALGDSFVIPLDDFSETHTITSITYNAGSDDTSLACSASTFPATGLPGLHPAKRIIVSGGDTERLIEMTPIIQELEGETLNEWRTQEVDMAFNNGSGFFANSSDNGIFDNEDVFWVRIYFGWKGASDRLLYFGGLLDLDFFEDDRESKELRVTAYGHLKELERYPGWTLRDSARKLLTVRGFEVMAAYQGDDFIDGVRRLKYQFPDKDFLSDLDINSLSVDTPPGYHVIKFRPPDKWQYDFGSWASHSAGSENITLTSAKGHTVKVNTPADYDLVPRYTLFTSITDGNDAKVDQRGGASVQLGEGVKQDFLFDFSHVIKWDGSSHTDVSYDAMNEYRSKLRLILLTGDKVYFIAHEKFQGIEFIMESAGYGGTLVWEYSQGFDVWGELSVTNTTSNFSQDGIVSWDLPQDWQRIDLEFGGSVGTISNVFAVKLRADYFYFNEVAVYTVRRLLRVNSDDDLTLDLRANMSLLYEKNFEEDVIALDDGAGGVETATWQANLSVQQLTEDLLNACSYPAAKRTLDALKYSLDSAVISSYGPPPLPYYRKKCTALAVDTSTSPETVYLGIGDEIWKVTETGEFEFIDRLEGWDDYDLEIKRLVIDGNGYLQGVAWKKYDRNLVGANKEQKRNTLGVVFRSTSLTAITEQNKIEDSGVNVFYNGLVCYRNTETIGVTEMVGQTPGYNAGENIASPYDHRIINMEYGTWNMVSNKPNGLTTDAHATDPVIEGPLKTLGWYTIATGVYPDIYRFELGSSGFCSWDEGSDSWLFMYWHPTSGNQLTMVDYQANFNHHYNIAADEYNAIAACNGGGRIFYISIIEWDNLGDLADGSNLSDNRIMKVDLNTVSAYVAVFDFSSDSIEASQSLSGLHEASWDKIKSCTILEMCFNSTENTLHGCLLDRFTLQYHWFVYDISNDKLYSSQTGTGFDFNEGMQLKGFVFNSEDDKVYAVTTDRRYNSAEAFLVCADFDNSRAAGSEIQISKCSTILAGETDLLAGLAMGGNGRIYGVSSPNRSELWQYDDSFYPRILLANLGDDDLRSTLTDAVQVLNRMLLTRPERTIRIIERDTYDGSATLAEDTHVSSFKPLRKWPHYYDRVEVDWENPITGEKGVAAQGSGGWERRVLKISNKLIQTRALAEVVAAQFYSYFNSQRRTLETECRALLQVEENDRVNYIANTAYKDIDRSQYWRLTRVEFDPESLTTALIGIE